MLSPTTTALLADMNASALRAAAGSRRHRSDSVRPNGDGGGRVAASTGVERRPLRIVQENQRDAGAAPQKATNGDAGGGRRRPMGPHEPNYLTRHDAFVTGAIARHSARASTNLRRDPLPDFGAMDLRERDTALRSVDRLLARLALEGGAGVRPGSESSSAAAGVGNRASGRQAEASSTYGNGTFGLVTTLGEGQDETFGSATTLGGNNREESKQQSAGSATAQGNNKSLASTTTTGGREDRSVSLLEESMILLSEDRLGGGDGAGDDDEETRVSGGEKASAGRRTLLA